MSEIFLIRGWVGCPECRLFGTAKTYRDLGSSGELSFRQFLDQISPDFLDREACDRHIADERQPDRAGIGYDKDSRQVRLAGNFDHKQVTSPNGCIRGINRG